MKKLIYAILVLTFVTTSCKKESGGGGNGDSLTSISVEVIQDNVIYGLQDFTFRVKGNDYITYTSSSTIYVNDVQITGNTFTPTSAGTFSVYAKKDNLTSPILTVTAIAIDLTVTSDSNTTYVEMDPFEFTATGSNGTDYTSQATFFVNDVEDDNNIFDPSVAGDYEVYATIGGDAIVSPTITVSATIGYASLTVSVSEPSVFVSQDVTFSAEDNLGRNLTNDATYYVDGVAITGNSYTANTAGDYEVYAIYDAIQSNTESFNAVTSSYTTKVLVEDYTGAWCGYCPRLWWKLEDAVAQNGNIIPAAIHDDTPMLYEYANEMESEFGVTGFPTGKYNRTNTWNESESQLNNAQAELVGLGLAINSTRTGDNLDITVKVGFDLDYTNELKLVLYVVENNLIYDQVSYYNNDASTPVYGMGNPIPNFEHNNVVRKAFTDVFGDVIPSTDTESGDIYSRNFNVAIPLGTGASDVHNADNIHLIAFVVDGATKEVINVQKAEINEDKDFD